MKKILLQSLSILIVLFMLTPRGMADLCRDNTMDSATWVFYEPQEWDLSFEDAMKILYKRIGEDSFSDDNFQVSGLFRYMVHRVDGEYDRGWYIVFRKNGSPYYAWKYFVSSPDGTEVSKIDSPSAYDKIPSDSSVTDIEAVDTTFRKMIESDYISRSSVAEDTVLLSYEIDAASDPMDYTYDWFFGNCRTVPVMAIFSDGKETYEKQFYVQIALSKSKEIYRLWLFSDDEIEYWYMGSPYIEQFISYTTVSYVPMEIIDE